MCTGRQRRHSLVEQPRGSNIIFLGSTWPGRCLRWHWASSRTSALAAAPLRCPHLHGQKPIDHQVLAASDFESQRLRWEEMQRVDAREAVRRKAAGRIASRGLASGWTAWREHWEEMARQRRLLAAASARLSKPQLVRSFGLWRASWQDDQHGGQVLRQARLYEAEHARAEALAEEVKRLRAANDDMQMLAAEAQRTAVLARPKSDPFRSDPGAEGALNREAYSLTLAGA